MDIVPLVPDFGRLNQFREAKMEISSKTLLSIFTALKNKKFCAPQNKEHWKKNKKHWKGTLLPCWV